MANVGQPLDASHTPPMSPKQGKLEISPEIINVLCRANQLGTDVLGRGGLLFIRILCMVNKTAALKHLILKRYNLHP